MEELIENDSSINLTSSTIDSIWAGFPASTDSSSLVYAYWSNLGQAYKETSTANEAFVCWWEATWVHRPGTLWSESTRSHFWFHSTIETGFCSILRAPPCQRPLAFHWVYSRTNFGSHSCCPVRRWCLDCWRQKVYSNFGYRILLNRTGHCRSSKTWWNVWESQHNRPAGARLASKLTWQ